MYHSSTKLRQIVVRIGPMGNMCCSQNLSNLYTICCPYGVQWPLEWMCRWWATHIASFWCSTGIPRHTDRQKTLPISFISLLSATCSINRSDVQIIIYTAGHFSAAYLLLYIISLVTLGIPISLLELALGQYTSEGPITCWKMAPIFKGMSLMRHRSVNY